MIDIRSLLETAHAAKQQAKQDELNEQEPAYRVGSSGCIDADGNIYGGCHRISHARFIGKETPPEFHMQIMFAAGESNEDVWIKRLEQSGYKGKILRHDDCLVDVQIEGVDARLVGHPDIVLADEDGNYLQVLELKGIYGNSTAVSVMLDDKPKDDNLIQAAVYSMCLDVPAILCYTCANFTSVNFFDQKKYGVKSIPPFYKMFYLQWMDDQLQYRSETSANWVSTVITKEGIKDYYRLLTEMNFNKDLGPRPISKSVDGSALKWDKCKYCDFSKLCDEKETNYTAWMSGKGGDT